MTRPLFAAASALALAAASAAYAAPTHLNVGMQLEPPNLDPTGGAAAEPPVVRQPRRKGNNIPRGTRDASSGAVRLTPRMRVEPLATGWRRTSRSDVRSHVVSEPAVSVKF